jgi:bifunctional DNA-binding transcriptional regulator/antitoxin component of YhaV-PrlF toxin-antitoxin module
MNDLTSTLTERGQVSLPASLRKAMGLKTGQRLRWQRVSASEVRVVVESATPAGPLAALGLGPKLRGTTARRTAAWMKELREGEA